MDNKQADVCLQFMNVVRVQVLYPTGHHVSERTSGSSPHFRAALPLVAT